LLGSPTSVLSHLLVVRLKSVDVAWSTKVDGMHRTTRETFELWSRLVIFTSSYRHIVVATVVYQLAVSTHKERHERPHAPEFQQRQSTSEALRGSAIHTKQSKPPHIVVVAYSQRATQPARWQPSRHRPAFATRAACSSSISLRPQRGHRVS
jgi:hypothetical protein